MLRSAPSSWLRLVTWDEYLALSDFIGEGTDTEGLRSGMQASKILMPFQEQRLLREADQMGGLDRPAISFSYHAAETCKWLSRSPERRTGFPLRRVGIYRADHQALLWKEIKNLKRQVSGQNSQERYRRDQYLCCLMRTARQGHRLLICKIQSFRT